MPGWRQISGATSVKFGALSRLSYSSAIPRLGEARDRPEDKHSKNHYGER